MNIGKVCAVAVAMSGLSAVANTVTWKGEGRVDDWNWNEAGNFEENAVPGSGDTVVIPAGLTVYVKPTDTDSRGIVSALKLIKPTDAASRLVIETAGEDDVLELSAAMNSFTGDASNEIDDTYRNGELVKLGPGELKLMDTSSQKSYYTRLTVREGSLRMPYQPNIRGRAYYGHVTVDEGATLYVGTANSQGYNYTQPRGLWGKGTITVESGKSQEIRLSPYFADDAVSTFEGTITGALRVHAASGRAQLMLTGTNSTFSGYPGVISGGTIGVAKFGMSGNPSSLGKNSVGIHFDENGGRYLYLGKGEVTDKGVYLSYPEQNGNRIIDGGAFGGLELRGTVDADGVGILTLTGSNAVPCVFAGQMTGAKISSLEKTGSGTWNFAFANHGTARYACPCYAVREGTLQFDSLRPAEETCALGFGTNRVEAYKAKVRDDAAHRVDYNFLLGSTNAQGGMIEGVLEPVAGRLGGITNTLSATDRPIALLGDGRIRMNAIDNGGGVERRLTLCGVRSAAPGLHTLTLDGTGSNDNMIADIVDGPVGQVAVVKEGSGTWVLAGTNSFSGGLTVKAGCLVLNNSKTYSWYRLAVSRLNGGGQLQIGELGLYDKDGANQVKGITVESKYDASVLRRGKAADGRNSIRIWTSTAYFNYLFDNTATMFRFKIYGDSATTTLRPGDRSNGYPVASKPATWYHIDFRLSEWANPVTSYDMIAPLDNIDPEVKQGSNGDDKFKNSIRGWKLLGSVDGIHWDELHEIADASDTTAEMHYAEAGKTNFWMAAQTKFDKNETAHEGGVAIASGIATGFPMLSNSTVSVEPDAELVVEGEPLAIGKFRIGQGGGGTIRNAKFAATGEFAVDGLDFSEGSVKLHGTYVDVEGLANIENWTPTEGGVASRRYVLSVNGSDIIVYKKGALLIVR